MADKRDKPPTSDVRASARRIPQKGATFPPDRWSDDVVTKSRPPATLPPVEHVKLGAATLVDANAPPSEGDARGFLNIRFKAAGYQLQPDYRFTAPGIAVVLDGYDPAQRAGYVYISHADADVVSDIGHAEELAFKQMFDTGQAFVLAIHDRDIDQLSTLEHRLDEFLAAVHRRRQGR